MPSFYGCTSCGALDLAQCSCDYSESSHPPPPPSTPVSSWNFPPGSSSFSTHIPGYYTPPAGTPGPSSAPAAPTYPQDHPSYYATHGPHGGVPYTHYSPTGSPFHPASYRGPPPSTPPIIDPMLSRPPLEDSTAAVVNGNGKRMLGADSTSTAAAKRSRGGGGAQTGRGGRGRGRGRGGAASTAPIHITSATPGAATVAPPTTIDSAASVLHAPVPLASLGSVIRKRSRHEPGPSTQASASDVWFHLYHLLGSREEPPQRPDDQPRMYDKPSDKDCTFVACRLCKKRWSTWLCKNGMTATIRDHFQIHHYEEWRQSVIDNRLKGWEDLAFKQPAAGSASGTSEPQPEPFTLDGLGRRIVRWIAADDQAINVVDNDLFHEVVRYASTSAVPLQDRDILHRTHARALIVDEYKLAIEALRRDLQSTEGRISFTSDMWTCRILRGYMAVTIHFCAKNAAQKLELRSRLRAFRYVPGRHTGANMAAQFITILEELGILHKVGCITLDNASNCETMMEDLARLLDARGISFSRDGNRLSVASEKTTEG
ncbi:hypothetical protein LXA43DRAFT_1067898 [Ganoderma leucocontextum]|nr:hypothetical protein LXA43DRAFT_1067898 [Ganoderma leucocontextum]